MPAPRPRPISLRLVLTLATLLVAAPARAHDFWIEPSSFTPKPHDPVLLRLLVGERFAGDAVPRSDAMIVRFSVAGPHGEIRAQGRDGADPAGVAVVEGPGLYVAGYRSRASTIEIEPGKFAGYLQNEGLDAIRSLRAARGETDQPARERFSRCAKALLAVGATAARQADAPLGLTLELVAERNPYALAAGDELPLRLTYDGAPIAGIQVTALSKDHPAASVAARTDREGRVKLRLAAPGTWLAKAVHMTPLPAGEDAQFESEWASLTFALRDGPRPQ
jgi:uncharacterized GH25 family protein